LIRLSRGKKFGVDAIRKEEKFRARNALVIQQGIAHAIGNGSDIVGAAIDPLFKSIRETEEISIRKHTKIADGIGPAIGDIEDEGATPNARGKISGYADEEGRRVRKDEVGPARFEQAHNRHDHEGKIAENAREGRAAVGVQPNTVNLNSALELPSIEVTAVLGEDLTRRMVRHSGDHFDVMTRAR